MQPMLNIAIRAARRAGDMIVRALDKLDTLQAIEKGRNDYVTEVDRQAEAAIIEIISKAYPDHSILAEESGHADGNEYQWIIDPLDGTLNFIHGMPHFAVSIALQVKGRTELGVIYDPIRQELFTCIRGAGARLDDKRIRVTTCKTLEKALIGTGFPFRKDQPDDLYMETFTRIQQQVSGIRRPGAAVLDLAYVAAGRFDGFWEIGLKSWDMAAGALMILEAGGLVADLSGGSDYLDCGNIVAGNPKIFKALLQTIHPCLPRGYK